MPSEPIPAHKGENMSGPMMQRVITFINGKGDLRSVVVGYSSKQAGDPADSMVCVAGDDSGLPHMTWAVFKRTACDLAPQFITEVWETLRKSPVRKTVKVTKRIIGRKTIVTITVEE